LVSDPSVELVVVSPYPDWPNPGRVVTRAARVKVGSGREESEQSAWTTAWRTGSELAQRALRGALDDVVTPPARPPTRPLSGPAVADAVCARLDDSSLTVLAASSVIRDVDLVAGAFPPGSTVWANRGLSGIDGTMSTAWGMAAATGRFVRVVVGDLAFLHDLNALQGAEPGIRMQIIVLNDDGGGIFSLLEYGALAERDIEQAATFERMFATPHGADLSALCRGFGVAHRVARTPAELNNALDHPEPGVSVVEVPADRSRLRSLHAAIGDRVRQDVGGFTP
jgi:2-succinyl-5-enolpyruvyl-6-hydroxy-3-cyclohexene-1-carboxylate synthase